MLGKIRNMNNDIIEAKLEEINKIIQEEYRNESDIGALSGLSGMALFQFHYSKYLDVQNHADFGVDILEYIIKKLNEGYSSPLYLNGIAGFGWTIDFLELSQFIVVGSDDLLKGIDDYLVEVMKANLKQGNYDFLHGAIGQAYYFFYRYKNTASKKLKNKYITILKEFISSLKTLSEQEEGKIKWLSVLTYQPEKKGYNLCLSHGISSIISILSKLYNETEFKDMAAPLLNGGINYILSFKNAFSESFGAFPNWVLQSGKPEGKGRLAWCYGDLGIGTALFQASVSLNDINLKKEALIILKEAAAMKNKEITRVEDAGVCHGAFGNALIFKRLYRETKEEVFKVAMEFWITSGLEMGIFNDGFAGYKTWNPDDKTWYKDTTLLNGIAGVGLVMIAYLSDFDSDWDACLMIN